MNISIERQEKCLATLRVEIPSATVAAEKSKILSQYAKDAKIPGFRPGKAPLAVIEKRYQKDIKEDIEYRLVNQSLQESLKKEQIKVLDFGNPDKATFTAEGSFTFETVLTLAPDFTLPEYKGIAVTVPSLEVSEDEINNQLDGLRQRFADFTNVEDRAVALGDFAIIDYTSTLDGKSLEEALGRPAGYLAGREGFWVKMQDDAFLPGFASQLVGLQAGESKDVNIVIPNDFPIEELREKSLVFHVTLKEIKQQELPDLNDEFASKLMGPDKTVNDLRETISEGMKANKKKEIDDMKINQLIAHFDQLVEFDIPESLLQAETQNQADALVQSAAQSGMNDEEITSQREALLDTASAQAKTNIKTNFILQEIADKENIIVNDQELVQHLFAIAQRRNEDPTKFIKALQRGGQIPGIRNSLLINKALDFLLEHASVAETTATTSEA
ncbi:MAG: trigger factor [Verrucomicrobiota bacterium]|jgi:trigger factor